MAEYDGPWKEMIDQKTRQALALLFPDVEQDTDWSHDCDSLDAELQKLYPEGRAGKRLADKLMKVRCRSGDDRYLHFEVQGTPQEGFERRMYVYQYRGDDRFGLPMEALVILADDDPDWRPTTYVVQLKYTRLVFEFQPVKLLDWASRIDELLVHPNPVGLFIAAHLKSRQTLEDPEERACVKLDSIKNLRARKLDLDELRQFYRWLDWMLDLPPDFDARVLAEVSRLEKEDHVPFVTFAERNGLRKGLLMGLSGMLELKFGEAGLALMPDLERQVIPEVIQAVFDAVKTAASPDDLRKLLPSPANGAAS